MPTFNLSRMQQYLALVSTLVSLVIALYHFLPKIIQSFQPLEEHQLRQFINEHESFVRNGNVEAMISRYHPDFSMDALHHSGYTESFDLSQIQKHLADLQRIEGFKVGKSDVHIKMIDDSEALISVSMNQQYPFGLAMVNEQLFQSMIIVKHQGKPKIFKVISVAKRHISNISMTSIDAEKN